MASDPEPFTPDPYEQQQLVPDALLKSGLSRRRVLQIMGALGGAAVVGGGVTAGVLNAQRASADPYVLPSGFTGTMADLKHVVILMQENRSFDHYYSALKGVRGANDKQALVFQNGNSVFKQPNGSGTLPPYNVNQVSSLTAGSLDHSYTNMPTWDQWVAKKGTNTMRYFTGEELPYQYSLASQFTISDMNFCSVHGPTTPNRVYLWSGNAGGRTSNGNETGSNTYVTRTAYETLDAAGISYRTYVDNSSSGSSFVGDYTDNPLRGFTAVWSGSTTPGTGIRWKAGATAYASHGLSDNDSDANLVGVLSDFIAACQPGAQYPLPEVSWVVAPYGWSEHPAASPEHGAHYSNRVIQTLMANEDLWNSTLLIMNFDENDGIFDHVLPPRPESNVPQEGGSSPYGYGPRVPMVLVSPWTRGGYVYSEVTDHTSVIRFLEQWSAYMVANGINGHTQAAYHGIPTSTSTSASNSTGSSGITAWRRAISGDLTPAIDFAHPIVGPVSLPDTAALVYLTDHDSGTIGNYVDSDDVYPDTVVMQSRPLYFHPHGDFVEDRTAGTVTANLSVWSARSGKAISFSTFPDKYATWANTPHTVYTGTPLAHTVDVKPNDGKYAFTVYGPDGFVRSHHGTVVEGGQTNAGLPQVTLDLVAGASPTATFSLGNDGDRAVRYTLTANDYLGGMQTFVVQPQDTTEAEWPLSDAGYYDVVITADTGTGWVHRYAGRVAQLTA